MHHFKFYCLVIASACVSARPLLAQSVVPAGESDPSWAAIGKGCTPSSPALSISRVRLDSAPALTHGPHRTMDDAWSDIARDTPGGFAGVIRENGVPTVFLTDTTKKAEASVALAARHMYYGPAGPHVRAARWNFMQLAEWYRYFRVALDAPINFSDIDEGKNRITFGTADSASRTVVEQRLARLDVPCYLVGLVFFNMVRDRGGAR